MVSKSITVSNKIGPNKTKFINKESSMNILKMPISKRLYINDEHNIILDNIKSGIYNYFTWL